MTLPHKLIQHYLCEMYNGKKHIQSLVKEIYETTDIEVVHPSTGAGSCSFGGIYIIPTKGSNEDTLYTLYTKLGEAIFLSDVLTGYLDKEGA